jgi:hypothetical protein
MPRIILVTSWHAQSANRDVRFRHESPREISAGPTSNSQNHHSSGGRKAIHSRLNGLSRLGINDQGVRRKLRGLAGCPAHPDIKTPMKSKPVPALLMAGSPLICEQICAWQMVSPTASTLTGHTPRCSSLPLAPGVEGTILADPMISLGRRAERPRTTACTPSVGWRRTRRHRRHRRERVDRRQFSYHGSCNDW